MDRKIKYRYFIAGSNPFVASAVNGISDELDPLLASAGWSDEGFPKVPALSVVQRRMASVAATIALTVGVWLSLKFADKAFDAIYENTIKDAIDSYIKRVVGDAWGHRKVAMEYQSLVYIEDLNVSVLVRLIIESEDDMKNGAEKINMVHRLAHKKIAEYGKLDEVHCYTIRNGCCNIEPELFGSINMIKPKMPVLGRKIVRLEAE